MTPDPIDDLREQLRAPQEAAARIAGQVPPQGWASEADRDATATEVQSLIAMLHGLRDLVPDDLWDQIREVLRQLLVLLRTILDLIVDRLATPADEQPDRTPGPRVQDIPIA